MLLSVHLREGSSLSIKTYFSHPEISVEEEVYLYDGLSFFGEVGGYMGLYLGFSLLSIYKHVEGLTVRLASKTVKELS